MRVLIMAKGEAKGPPSPPKPPSPEAMAAFKEFNDALIKAGVLVGEGRLHPSAQGKQVRFEGKARTVTDGPFAESKEVVGGYWLWQVGSMDEALDWLKRAPFEGGLYEVRQIFERPGM